MVYAEVDGNIGWFGGALAPIRPRADWSGMLPVPGDGRYEWAGYLPGSLLPRVLNPQQGFFATANQFNVPADHAYRSMSATAWAEPYRFEAAGRTLFGSLSRPVVLARLAAPDAVFGADPAAGRDAVMLETLKAALQDVKAKAGWDSAAWQWGQLHHIQFEHELTLFLSEALATPLQTPRYPVGGDNDTLHRASYRTSDFRVTSGASYRQVIDLADWNNSLAINVPGQSADPASPHYKNLIEAWAKGEYFPMAFSRAKVDSLRADRLVLRPAR